MTAVWHDPKVLLPGNDRRVFLVARRRFGNERVGFHDFQDAIVIGQRLSDGWCSLTALDDGEPNKEGQESGAYIEEWKMVAWQELPTWPSET